jgi:hypothetical protein
MRGRRKAEADDESVVVLRGGCSTASGSRCGSHEQI